MRSEKNQDLFWTGIISVVGLATFGVLYGIVQLSQLNSLRQAACGPEEVDCFRQWVAALGGWAAVAAAIPTIYYLSAQVRSATTHQKVNFALSIRANVALSHSVKLAAMEIAALKTAHFESEHDRENLILELKALKTYCLLLRERLSRPAIAEFEMKVGVLQASRNSASITFMMELAISKCDGHLNQSPVDFSIDKTVQFLSEALDHCESAQIFASELNAAAQSYLTYVDELGAAIT